MTYTKFRAVNSIFRDAANNLISGCRNREKYVQNAVIDYVKKNAAIKHKNSAYIVYTTNANLGTKKWGDYYKLVNTYPLNKLRETEKCYITNYNSRIYKSSVIGFLSE